MNNVHYYHHVDTPPLTIWTAMVVHPVEGFSVFVCFHIYGILSRASTTSTTRTASHATSP